MLTMTASSPGLGILVEPRQAQRTVGVQGAEPDWSQMPWQSQVPWQTPPPPAWQNVPNAPNDFQLAVTRAAGDYRYLPVKSGWIVGTPVRGAGFGNAAAIAAMGDASIDAVSELTKIQRTQLWLSGISTFAILALAGVAIFNLAKGSKKP